MPAGACAASGKIVVKSFCREPRVGQGDAGRNLFTRALVCLEACDPAEKIAAIGALMHEFAAGELSIDKADEPAPIGAPGRPQRPRLVAPRDLPQRGLGTIEGRLALIHAVAHIEFNAINLACDAVYRFRDMPRD